MCLGCLLLSGCERVQRPNRPLAESFQALTLTGDVLDRDELSGRPWVVTVWRPDCAPCLKQLTQVRALKQRIGSSSLGYLALSLDDDEDHVFAAAARLEPEGTVALAKSETMGPLSLSQLPATAFLDASATVVAAASGEQTDETLEKWARVVSQTR